MSYQMFVDSDEEDHGFDSEGSGVDDDGAHRIISGDDEVVNGGEDAEESGGDSGGKEAKGKKRKLNSKKESKKNKKAKKLGPKQVKGAKREEKLTTEEIKELTAKEYAQYSNLYSVQIEEVLEEVSVSEKRRTKILSWVEGFQTFVQNISKSKKFTIGDYKKIVKHVHLPLPVCVLQAGVEKSTKNQQLRWMPPWSVNVRGSWGTGTELNKVSPVDIFLEMPYDYLAKSDTLNHRYHIKRAIYLAFLALKMEERGDLVKFTFVNGEYLKPVISLRVSKVEVLIHAVPPSEYFKVQKLSCERNNLRYAYFFNEKAEDDPDTSTQHYNFTILEDALANEIHTDTSTFLESRPTFQNAIKLLKIWLLQRELLKGYGGFSGLIVTQFVKYLHKLRKISENMTVFQVIRVFFTSLIQMDLSENGISFAENPNAKAMAHLQWDIVLLDDTGVLNFTANVSDVTYKRIQEEARRALLIIDGGNVAGFLALFVTKVKFALNFDHVIRIERVEYLEKHFRKHDEHKQSLLNHSGFLYPVVVSTVGALIKSCLGQRITILDSELPNELHWKVNENVPEQFPSSIRFGLNINRETSQRLIEKCESDSHEAVARFREFWGKKSELRRFKDGTFFESVALDDLVKGFGKTRVCYQMVYYILKTHVRYKLAADEYIDSQVETLVQYQYAKVIPPAHPNRFKKVFLNGKAKLVKIKDKSEPAHQVEETVCVDDVTKLASNSFDDLSKILRQLDELPLQISTVQGTSSVLRFSHIQPTPPQAYFQSKCLTAVEPAKNTMLLVAEGGRRKSASIVDDDDKDVTPLPTKVKVPRYVEPIGVIIHLETSGQWPDNIQAIDRLKCAFLIKIGQLLHSKFGLTVQPFARHLDVLKDGFVFRIKLTYFREVTLLRELRDSDGVLRVRDNPESLRLEKEALILPQLTSTLHSFHLQFEAFGKTCRIAKRWIASQLLMSSPMEYNRNLNELDCRFSEESIELLVANLFLNYAPHLSFPSETHVGFQRFLYLLANTDFRAVPIIINFNDKLTAQDVSTLELEFVKLRTTLPALFIATPFDQRGSVWTRQLSPVILGRAQLLAQQALTVIETHFKDVTSPSIQGLIGIFRTSSNQFDVIIKLKDNINARSSQNIDKIGNPLRFTQYNKKTDELLPVTDFDPVQMYLQDLRNTFGHMAVFLHDIYGGNLIGVVWKPNIFKAVNLTSSSVRGRQLGRDGDSIVTNVGGALEAFELMGNGIVEEIQTQSDRWELED